MAERSKIEWTDASWNPIRARRVERLLDADPGDFGEVTKIGWHCEKVSEACRNCYAEAMNKRLGTGLAYKPDSRAHAEIFLDEKMLLEPLHWRKPKKIFVCSMTDVFAEWVTDEMLDRIFAVMALCPQQTFQVLTKQPRRMREYICTRAGDWDLYLPEALVSVGLGTSRGLAAKVIVKWPLPNVWLGVTAEDQGTANARIPELLATPAAVRFVSCEPLLGPIDLSTIDIDGYSEFYPLKGTSDCEDEDGQPMPDLPGLDWVICGSESGPKARRCDLDWVRSLRDQCVAADVAFFWKQYIENNKKIALPELDGKQWAEFPR